MLHLFVEGEVTEASYADRVNDDGEVRQEFNICLACRIVGGELRGSEESLEVGFVSAAEIDRLDMHQSIRRRIRDFLESREPVIE